MNERIDERVKRPVVSDLRSNQSVLHVVVGHSLRTYFLNSVRSIRTTAPDAEILIVDNASPDADLRIELSDFAASDPRARLLLRESNDPTNGKVGGLYDAYREAFDIAIEEGFEYLHLIQGDMQVLWWDDTMISRANELFESEERCVNVYTCLLSSDKAFSTELEPSDNSEVLRFRSFGLTDTGLYHLKRWKELEMSFAGSEVEHAGKYRAQGFTVLCHPWPTDAPIPWPAVVRRGVSRGREIALVKPFLLRPLSTDDIADLKKRSWTWLEDVCVPWGWTCLTPMWTTQVAADYWAVRRQDAAANGLISALPRWDRRGLDGRHLLAFWRLQYRPSLVRLFVVVPVREVFSRFVRQLANGIKSKSTS